MFFLNVIIVVIFCYGILSLVQDITNEVTYKRISHDMKIIIFAKDLEKNLEKFIIEFYQMKKVNCYKQFVIVDLNERDNILKIESRLYNNEINAEVLNKEEGQKYVANLFQNEN